MLSLDVDHLNRTFPKYPMTVQDKGWVYGVWYCGTAWRKARMYGEYPPTFLARALALVPGAERIIHCPSGTVTGPGMTVDLVRDKVRVPQVVADAARLPFPDSTFDFYLSDPPYSDVDAKHYGTGHYPLNKAMKEAHRVVENGGLVGLLHKYPPSYNRTNWEPLAMIAVMTGFSKIVRMFTVVRVVK